MICLDIYKKVANILRPIGIVEDVFNLKITKSINKEFFLEFELKNTFNKNNNLKMRNYILVDNNLFTIEKITKTRDENGIKILVYCTHISFEMAKETLNFTFTKIGKTIEEIVGSINSKFTITVDDEIKLEKTDIDEENITNLEILNLICSQRKYEICRDSNITGGFTNLLLKRYIGNLNSKEIFIDSDNLISISRVEDGKNIVNRLIPIGKDGLTLDEIYVTGSSIIEFGPCIGYKKYNLSTKGELYKAATLEMGQQKSQSFYASGIDMPSLDFEITVNNFKGDLGDCIRLIDTVLDIDEKVRVVSITYFPFENNETTLKVSKHMIKEDLLDKFLRYIN